MDGRPLPPDLKRRVIDRGCAYLSAISRTLDPPEDEGHYSATARSDGRRGRNGTEGAPLLARLRKMTSQLFGF